MEGGKPIGSGGFGCVFRPALLCEGETHRAPRTVTKLMNKQNFKQEEAELKKIAPHIAKIPNNEKYFVVTQIKKCIPQSYSQEDLINFNTVCKPLLKGKYKTSATYIEGDTRNGEFIGLNLPDGGMDVFDYLIESRPSKKDISKFLGSYMLLIQKGIRPMNIAGVCHFDVKSENMVYNSSLNETKLIDWGFAQFIPETAPAPILEKPLMQNSPFTILLFYRKPQNNPILQFFRKFLVTDGGGFTTVPLSTTIRDQGIISSHKKEIFIKELSKVLRSSIFFNEDSIVSFFGTRHVLGQFKYMVREYFDGKPARLLKCISNQLANVLVEFSYNERGNHFVDFDLTRFFRTVYRFNVDIYGALTVIHKLPAPFTEIQKIMDQLMFGDEYTTKPYVIEDVLTQIQILREILVPTVPIPVPVVDAHVNPLQARLNLIANVGKKGLRQTSLGGKTRKKNKKNKKGKKGKYSRKKKNK